MNKKRPARYSGIALLAALVIALSGCNNGQSTPVVPNPPGSSASDTSVSDNSGGSSEDTQNSDSTSVGTATNSPDSEPPDSIHDPDVYDPTSSDTNTSTSSGDPNSGGASGSSQQTASSTSESEPPKDPDPPPVVVIPDIAVPTSPGTKLVTAKNGAIDYSNADQGYISAKYTGDKAKCKLQVKANGEEYTFDVTVGGKTEYFPLSMGNGTYTIILRELVDGTAADYSVVLRQEIEVNMSDPLSPFTCSNRYVSYSKDSDCVYKAAELCTGKNGSIEKIAAIFQWVTENVSYDYELSKTVKKGYVPDPDTTFRKKTGICYDYASLMAAMLRSQSIPTRLVIGNASPDIHHAWNEIYTEQTGWITPELLLKNNGYNIADATFYSTAKNKQQIADYISDPSNYYSIYYY